MIHPLNASFASKSPSAKLCQIMHDMLYDNHTPESLCKKYNGRFCLSVENMGQAVCASNQASFCSSYKVDGEEICHAG